MGKAKGTVWLECLPRTRSGRGVRHGAVRLELRRCPGPFEYDAGTRRAVIGRDESSMRCGR